MDRDDPNSPLFELTDLGPQPWNPGNGLIAEDVRQWAAPMAALRERGVSFEDIGARYKMTAQQVVELLTTYGQALVYDAGKVRSTSGSSARDRRARVREPRSFG